MARYLVCWALALAVLLAAVLPAIDDLQAKQEAVMVNHVMELDAPSAGKRY